MADRYERGTVLVAHPAAGFYGSDRAVLETVAALSEERWRVVVALGEDGALAPALRAEGAEVVLVDVPVLRRSTQRPGGVARFLLGSLPAARRIDALLKRLQPDVVHVSTMTLPLWTLRARASRIPVLVHVQENERESPVLVREAIARPLQLATRVVADSASTRSALLEVVPKLAHRTTVIPPGIDGPPVITLPRGEVDDGLRIVCVGRLSPRKGIDVAIEALGLLVSSGTEAHLDIVGDVFVGNEWYEAALREQVRRLGLEDRVAFHGFQPDVWRFLTGADVAVVPSRADQPFATTALEAVLAARPVVFTSSDAAGEMLTDYASAIEVEPDDPQGLARALWRVAASWSAFRRSALALAPLAGRRFSAASYRRAIALEIELLAPHLQAASPALAS